MKTIIIYLSIIGALVSCAEEKTVYKRQIFREQVLPHAGGKIPDSAFQVDRLALNKLQKEGIAVPDGFQLEPREYQVYPYNQKTRRPTFLAALKPSNRFVSPAGEYHYNDAPPSIETTYAIPQISGHPLSLPPKIPATPILTNPLKLPNSASLHPNYFGAGNQQHQAYRIVYDIPQQFYHPAPSPQQQFVYQQSRPYNAHLNSVAPGFHPQQPQQQHSLGHGPLSSILDRPIAWSTLQQDYVASSLFNDFETFFKGYAQQNGVPHPSQYSKRGVRNLDKETETLNSNIDVKIKKKI